MTGRRHNVFQPAWADHVAGCLHPRGEWEIYRNYSVLLFRTKWLLVAILITRSLEAFYKAVNLPPPSVSLQVFIWLTALLATLVLVVLRVEEVITAVSWWLVLSPMFIADALNTYFCVIVLIRMYLDGVLKPAALRALWSFSVLTLGFTFKFLLCRKLSELSEPSHLEYSAVMSPVFVLLQLILIRACHLN